MIMHDAAIHTNETTRIFVSGLPPKFTSSQLASHFGSQFKVTDAHVVTDRRIGFVGFADSSSAQNAAKHFNKSYVRMSRIAVDLAKPVEVLRNQEGNVIPISKKRQQFAVEEGVKKRKRPREDDGEHLRTEKHESHNEETSHTQVSKPFSTTTIDPDPEEETKSVPAAPSDSDWLRGRTTRTLDLVDPDDSLIQPDEKAEDPIVDQLQQTENSHNEEQGTLTTHLVKVPNARLFLRNLAFSVTEADLQQRLLTFGKVLEVGRSNFLFSSNMMNS